MYKSKLQVLCQKNSWKLPLYDTVRDGPDHGARFTATVTVNGATFESPGQFTSSKLAQNGAAEVAFNHFSALSVGPRQPISPIGVVQKSASPGNYCMCGFLFLCCVQCCRMLVIVVEMFGVWC